MYPKSPLRVVFFRTEAGNEPVRQWLRTLSRDDRKAIGEGIKTVQFGWPLGMPVVRKLESGLWEIRTPLGARTARVLVTIGDDLIVLLHGFIKKSRKTPSGDLALTRQRLKLLREDS